MVHRRSQCSSCLATNVWITGEHGNYHLYEDCSEIKYMEDETCKLRECVDTHRLCDVCLERLVPSRLTSAV